MKLIIFYTSVVIMCSIILNIIILEQSRASSCPELFYPYKIINVPSSPEAVAIGDINNDGKNDVVITTSFNFDPQNDYKIFVFLQNDFGELSFSNSYPAGNGESIDIADLNNDGKNDVVVTDWNGIGVFIQRDNGTLADKIIYSASKHTYNGSYKTRTGDFNNDGLIDVVSIYWGTQSEGVDVYLQNNAGTLSIPVSYNITHGGFGSLEVGDVNNDGLTDIVVLNGDDCANNPEHIGILFQNSNGTFGTPVYYNLGIKNTNPYSIAIGDINHDSKSDLVITYGGNRPSSAIAVITQNNNSTFNNPVYYESYDIPSSVAIGDVNNDHINDIIVLHAGWDKMGVYYQKSDSSLSHEILYEIPHTDYYNTHGLSIGDINNDGLQDIIIANSNYGLIVFYSKSNEKVQFVPAIIDLLL